MSGKWSEDAKKRRCGKNNPNWNGGIYTNKVCIDCGKPVSRAAKRCSSCAKLGTTWKWSDKAKKNIRMEKNHQWKGGKSVDVHGYVRCYLPEHPNAFGKGYVREHRLVMEKHIGRYLTAQEIVHHIDGDKQNNDITNLMLFPNSKAHFSFNHNNAKSFICKHCGKSQVRGNS